MDAAKPAAANSNSTPIDSNPVRDIADTLRLVERLAWNSFKAIGVVAALLAVGTAAGEELWSGALTAFLRALSVSSILVLSASAVGAVLGFLFGIPRLLQQTGGQQADPRPAAPAAMQTRRRESQSLFKTNTSLEEISDWLTKIIVGIGLVQFETIVGYIRTCAEAAARYAAPPAGVLDRFAGRSDESLMVFFFGLIVASLLLSCLFVYLQTRTRIALLFQNTEQTMGMVTADVVEASVSTSIIQPDANSGDGGKTRPAAQDASDNDFLMSTVRFSDLKSAKELGSWGASQARLGNYAEAGQALQRAVALDPNDIQLKVRLAEFLRLRSGSRFVAKVLEILKQSPNHPEIQALAFQAQLDALYMDPPDGFNRAIEISALIKNSGFAADPMFHLRRACAFGQKYSYDKANGAQDLESTRQEALKSCRKVTELARSAGDPALGSLRKMLTGAQGIDTDLDAFRADKDFLALVRT
jgi:tetratricopeptide (TPR) repeat protein